MFEHDLVLKSGEVYLVGNAKTDGSREHATGLYARDTRHLSTFEIDLNGLPLETLSATVHDPVRGTVIAANPILVLDSGPMPPQQLLIEQSVSLTSEMHVRIRIQNFDRSLRTVELGLRLAADFRDLFDVRGFPRTARGSIREPVVTGNRIALSGIGLDGAVAETVLKFDREPKVTIESRSAPIGNESLTHLSPSAQELEKPDLGLIPGVRVVFPVSLEPHEEWVVNLTVVPRPASGPMLAVADPAPIRTMIRTDHEVLNRALEQSLIDLDSLWTTFPDGSLSAAGIPWFVAPFGRDSLINALQLLQLAPKRAVETLRTLAMLQGTKIDREREEEPGKILHEMRYGEMARIHEVPHSPYFGSIDATPLWLWVLAETVLWTRDLALFEELRPQVAAALTWVERYGDLDADGLIEYRTEARSGNHISHQVWKDSYDSLNYPDGAPVTGAITAVEVQGYLFAAYRGLAQVAKLAGDPYLEAEMTARADQIRISVEELFWLEPEGIYAQALDGAKQPVRVASSNQGHLLVCGLPSAERAARVITGLQGSENSSGWGIRTLSAAAASYNPMSYHNGSIWPHDNSLIGAGFYRYGAAEAGHAVVTALTDAAATMPLNRLPELYCGFARQGIAVQEPIPYPVSCSPQAWAAGSLPYLVCSMVGLQQDPQSGDLTVLPSFPDWIGEIAIANLGIGDQTGDLTVRKTATGYTLTATGFTARLRE